MTIAAVSDADCRVEGSELHISKDRNCQELACLAIGKVDKAVEYSWTRHRDLSFGLKAKSQKPSEAPIFTSPELLRYICMCICIRCC